jgi:hypothetical protein
MALETTTAKMTPESNELLCDFAMLWKLDGDWMTCVKCKRNLIASREDEAFPHASGCKFSDNQNPWQALRAIISPSQPVQAPVSNGVSAG